MANNLWITGDDVYVVIDDDNDSTSDIFEVQDAGASSTLFTLKENGMWEVYGPIRKSGAVMQLASNNDPLMQFLSGSGGSPSTVAEISSSGVLDVSLGSYGGLRLRTSAPSATQEGLCHVTNTPTFCAYLNGGWLSIP